MADIITDQYGLNRILETIAKLQGSEIRDFVMEEIQSAMKDATKVSQENVDKIKERIDTLSKVLDGDTDEEFTVENVISLLTEVKKEAKQNTEDLNALENRLKDSDLKTDEQIAALKELLLAENNKRKEEIDVVKADLKKAVTLSGNEIQGIATGFRDSLRGTKASTSSVGTKAAE
jgi:parvulin-like peptidyl-prolyl isomerase